jgi:hypothetical protein
VDTSTHEVVFWEKLPACVGDELSDRKLSLLELSEEFPKCPGYSTVKKYFVPLTNVMPGIAYSVSVRSAFKVEASKVVEANGEPVGTPDVP